MIVDTSAIMAVLLKEEDAEACLAALQGAPIRRMSGVSLVEFTVVADRKDNPVQVHALAKETGEPLLFKGNDFARTDITPAA